MSNKITPKEQARILHYHSALCYLLIENIDELKKIKEINQEATEFQTSLKKVEKGCETLLTELFNIKEVSKSVYLQDLARKLETVIRKNYNSVLE